MKFLALATLAIAASYVAAECNNMCSGHGVCGQNDACTCYRNWRGNDCSERTCQFGIAFVDTAQGDLNHGGTIDIKSTSVVSQWAPAGTFEEYFNFGTNEEAHAYMECSNKGLCDRSSGECVCFDGYEGSACQRTVCPNACSGNGVCRNINDVSQALSGTNQATDYLLWDGLKNQACVCDPGYSGVDCSERLCPKGHDPLIDETTLNSGVAVVYEQQTVTLETSGAYPGTNPTFKLAYTDVFGERWLTSAITMTDVKGAVGTGTATGSAADNIKQGLLGIPNSVIEGATVTTVGGAGTGGYVATIEFTHNAGDLNMLEIVDLSDTTVDTSAVAQTVQGTTTASECSGRGMCDYETGLCKCFRGYRLDDCSSQHALAFGSGGGL